MRWILTSKKISGWEIEPFPLCSLFPCIYHRSTLKFASILPSYGSYKSIFLGFCRPCSMESWLILWSFLPCRVIFLFLRGERTYACGTLVLLNGFLVAHHFVVGWAFPLWALLYFPHFIRSKSQRLKFLFGNSFMARLILWIVFIGICPFWLGPVLYPL